MAIGYCECGCGQKTRIAPQTSTSKKWTCGEPLRFVKGHFVPSPKFGKDHHNWNNGESHNLLGYRLIRKPDHPRSGQNGYVFEHILFAEKALGKPLPEKAQVHHVSNLSDNSSLVLCQDHKYHMLLHRRTRAYHACGYVDWIKCPYCQKWDNPSNLYVRPDGIQGWHRSCASRNESKNKKNRVEKKYASL